MKFQPKTQAELDAEGLLEAGEYDAEILTAEDAVSAKGNEMIKLTVGVYRKDGKQEWVWDYITANSYKLPNICRSAKVWTAYEAGELEAEMLVKRSVRVRVGIEPASASFPAKNKIMDYLFEVEAPAPAAAKADPDDGWLNE